MRTSFSYYKILVYMPIALCLFSAMASATEQTGLSDRQIIQSAIEFYRKSKTLKELIKSNPDFGPSAVHIYSNLLPDQLQKPLQTLAFDSTKKTLSIGHGEVELIDLVKGKVKFNGALYTFDRNLNRYQNLEKILQLLAGKKSARLVDVLVNQAFAQNRDEFPTEVSDKYRGKDIPKIAATYAVDGYLVYTSVRSIIKRVGMPKAANYITLALIASWAVNKAHAYAAPSCARQVNKLKSIMNESRISLSQLECGTTTSSGSESVANISFWTPDKKELPFYANWETSEVFVDSAVEVYHFGRRQLSMVEITIPGRNQDIKSEDGLVNYKKILEPYRKVFYEIGVNNSCHKCADEFKTLLVQKSPAAYAVDASVNSNLNAPGAKPTLIKK